MKNYRESDFLTVQEVADILRIGKSKCYDLANSKDCPFKVIKFNRITRIGVQSIV